MRWVFRVVFGLVALVVLAVVVLFLVPAERIAKLVTDQFEVATGRAMTLQGDVRPTLWPELGVNTGAVTIANADWSKNGPMLSAERLSIGVDMMALWRGDVRIKRIEADGAKVLLEVAKDGRGNWEMLRAGGEAVDATTGGDIVVAGGIPEFTMNEAVISGGSVSFIDYASGNRTDLTSIDATLRLPDFQGAAEVELSARMNGQKISVNAEVTEFAAFLAAGAVPVAVDIAIGGSKIGFKGRAGLDPVAAGGRLDADVADMKAVFTLIGQSAPVVPIGLGQRISVRGDVTMTGAGAVTLRDGTVQLDQNTLTGGADLTMAARPKLTASLSAGALDFSALTAEGAGPRGGSSGAAATGWSRSTIDVSGLQALDANIALQAASVDLGVAKLGRTNLTVVLENGRAVTEIKEIQAYDGIVAGTLVVNSRGGLSTRATLRGTDLRLKPLLVQLADYDRLQTTGDISVNLLGVGNSMDALMNSLSGEGQIRFGAGELAGFDLVGMLRTLDASYMGAGAKTIFDSIGAGFTIDKGVLVNDDLAFVAPLIRAGGKGRVGIAGQTLDYRLVPTLLDGQVNGGIKVPVLITGTWADPKFKLDLESLARERLDVEADKLKLQAEEALKKKLSEELGVTITDTKDIEDVLKRELEDRATKGLLDLLGGNR